MLTDAALKNMRGRYWINAFPETRPFEPSLSIPILDNAYQNLLAVYQQCDAYLKDLEKHEFKIDISFSKGICTVSFALPFRMLRDEDWRLFASIDPYIDALRLEETGHALLISIRIKYFRKKNITI